MDYLQEQFIGKTFNDKLNTEIADYLTQRKFEVLGFIPRPGAIAMVHTVDESGGIKALGGSDPFDIINDNFGKWLAGMCAPLFSGLNPPGALIGQGNPPLDIGAVARTIYYYNQSGADGWNASSAGVSFIQIGSGLTAPDVADTNIETAFPSAPESLRTTVIGSGAYAPSIGRVSTGTNIGPVTDAGTINELCLFTNMRGSGTHTFLMSHDAINPAVPFIIGETIFAQYFFQI